MTSPYLIPDPANAPVEPLLLPDPGPASWWLPRPVLVVARAFRTLWASGKARIGLVLLGSMILVAIFAPLIAPYSPTRSDFAPGLPSSRAHLLGTTGSGQDVFSQLVYGARVSLVVAFAAASLAIAANFLAAATAAVLGEAGLEFLGLGNPSTVSWGTMLYWAHNNNALLTGDWVLIFAPGLCIALLAAALSLVNFGIDALSNPRLREG